MSYDPEYAKQYRAANKDRLKEKDRQRYQLNKKQIIERVANTHREKMNSDPSYAARTRKLRAASERKSRRKPSRQEKISKRKEKISQLKNKIKLHCGCLNPSCKWQGEIPAYCLDFHHVDRKTKKFSIGAVTGISVKTLLEEIAKCTVLCAICHRQETWGDLDVSSLAKCNHDLVVKT